jgi:hypothetical protein
VGFISDVMGRKDIDQQGRLLAQQFAKRLSKERAGDAKRVAAEYQVLLGDAVGYQRRMSLGFVGKSRLVNALQWTLVEQGFAEDFARDIGSQLAITLAASE